MDETTTSLELSEDMIAAFAREWIEAWNAHDIDRILSHYREDVRFVSPFAARRRRPHGELRGRLALRDYFERGLASYPALHFEPIAALGGDRGRSPCTIARSKSSGDRGHGARRGRADSPRRRALHRQTERGRAVNASEHRLPVNYATALRA